MSDHYQLPEDVYARLERTQRVLVFLSDALPEVGARGGSMTDLPAAGMAALSGLLADELTHVLAESIPPFSG